MYGKSNVETYTAICKINDQWEFAVCLRKLKQGLCINLEGWGGQEREMGGRFEESTLTLLSAPLLTGMIVGKFPHKISSDLQVSWEN